MKTKCYCVYCPKHPLHKERSELEFPTNWEPGGFVWGEREKSGADVDCLKPIGDAFFELDLEPEDHEYPITAYGGGASLTGFIGRGFTVYAGCESEEYCALGVLPK